MAESDPHVYVDDKVVEDGLAQVRDDFIRGQSNGAETFLRACYLNGLQLWEAHRQRIATDIDEHGGIDNVQVSGYLSSHYSNAITCKDGKRFSAAAVFQAPLAELELSPSRPTFDLVASDQNGFVRISFGSIIGISALNGAYRMDESPLSGREDFREVIEGGIKPSEVAITEGVITSSSFDDKITISGLMYSVRCRKWYAKLREEFAPDPVSQPEQYAAWLASDPIPRLDIAFDATEDVVRRTNRYTFDLENPDFGRHPNLVTYFCRTTVGSLTEAGVNKMIRFGQLLNLLWRKEFGTDMPMPTGKTEQFQTEDLEPERQLALPQASTTA